MIKRRSKIFSISFLIINITLVIILGFTTFNGERKTPFKDIFQIWLDNYIYLLLIILALFVALLMEGLKNYVVIYRITKKHRPLLSFKVSILGKYYDLITPLASGGQVMQMYYFKKGNVDDGVSYALPIASFFFSQLAFVICIIFVFIFKSDLNSRLGFTVLAVTGTVLIIIVPLSLLLFSFMPVTFRKIYLVILKGLKYIKIIKNVEKIDLKLTKYLNSYRENLKLIINSKLMFFQLLLYSIIYQLAILIIPYLVLLASGINNNIIDTISLTLLVYASVSFIPTPGNSGAAEVSFGIIFSQVLENSLFWVVSLWRFASYYLLLLLGLSIIIYEMIKKTKE